MSDDNDSQSKNENNHNFETSHERNEFTPLYSNAPDVGALKLIVSFFFGFSISVTVLLAAQIYYGKSKVIPHGSVTSDNDVCSEIGASVLKLGGNAVDAAISTAFCMGVVNPHTTGLGSGGIMLIYSQRDGKVIDTIDFRVTRANDSGIGVPGFVYGLYLAHKLHGSLPWKTLVKPAEFVARSGFQIQPTVLAGVGNLKRETYNEKLLTWISHLKPNMVIVNNKLAETLSIIAEDGGVTEFYNKLLVNDLRNIINEDEIKRYKAITGSSTKKSFMGYDVIVSDDGTGGPLLLESLSYLNNSYPPLLSTVFSFKDETNEWPVSPGSHIAVADVNDVYVSMDELASEFAVIRNFRLPLIDFHRDLDQGCFIGAGLMDLYAVLLAETEYSSRHKSYMYVFKMGKRSVVTSFISGLGSVFGSQILTETGFVMNNILEITIDHEGSRPQVLLTPVIMVQTERVCGKRLIFGGGDVRDVAQVLSYALRDDVKNVSDAVEQPRVRIIEPRIALELNHKPALTSADRSFLDERFALLEAPEPYPSINAIRKVKDETIVVADSRGMGGAVMF